MEVLGEDQSRKVRRPGLDYILCGFDWVYPKSSLNHVINALAFLFSPPLPDHAGHIHLRMNSVTSRKMSSINYQSCLQYFESEEINACLANIDRATRVVTDSLKVISDNQVGILNPSQAEHQANIPPGSHMYVDKSARSNESPLDPGFAAFPRRFQRRRRPQ